MNRKIENEERALARQGVGVRAAVPRTRREQLRSQSRRSRGAFGRSGSNGRGRDAGPVPAALVLGTLAMVGVGLGGCQEEIADRPAAARPIKMFTIGSENQAAELELPGTIEPLLQADMAFEVAGRIVEFPVEEGQDVRAGQVLARLDPRDFQANLNKARARQRQAETDVERYRHLVSEGVTARRELELKERNLEVVRADASRAEKALEDAVLRAPFDGVVARKLVEDITNVQAKQGVLVLQDTSHLKVVVDVPERVMAQGRGDVTLDEVTARARPRVVVTSLADRQFPARLTEVATTADPDTRTFRATLTFDRPPDLNILPGMTARVILRRPGDETAGGPLWIPTRAVVGDAAGEAFVWLVDPDTMTVHGRPVRLGETAGDSIQILQGLGAGDVIAISGVHQLSEGAPVRRFDAGNARSSG